MGRGADVPEESDTQDFSASLVTVLVPDSAAAEAYRTLRANLLYAQVDDPPKVIALTSPRPREGKSTTCANLGVVLAEAGKRVLLVDCDLRRPTIHKVFGARNIWGLTNVLLGERSIQGILQEPVPNLHLVPVGPLPPNPAEILGSERFSKLIVQAREQFDYVLLDTPPVGAVSDVAVLSSQVDGVLLVLDAQHTPKEALRYSVKSLETVGARIIGAVTNNFKAPQGTQGGYESYTYSE